MANFLALINGFYTEVKGLVTSTGATDAGKIVQTGSDGRLDNSLMPPGVGASDTNVVQASEALNAGDLVNIYELSSGVWRARKADASSTGKPASGFVLAAVTSGNNATVFAEGTNTQVTGLTGSDLWLSATTPGATTGTAPSGDGQIAQHVGWPVSASAFNFQRSQPIRRTA